MYKTNFLMMLKESESLNYHIKNVYEDINYNRSQVSKGEVLLKEVKI